MLVEAFLVDRLLRENVSASKEHLSMVSIQVSMKDRRPMRTALATLAVSNGCFANRAWYLEGISFTNQICKGRIRLIRTTATYFDGEIDGWMRTERCSYQGAKSWLTLERKFIVTRRQRQQSAPIRPCALGERLPADQRRHLCSASKPDRATEKMIEHFPKHPSLCALQPDAGGAWGRGCPRTGRRVT